MSRRINNKLLLWNTCLYRVWVIIENAAFLWFFSWLLMSVWAFDIASAKGSMTMSLIWNAVNMATYWVWHYCFFKWFHVGAGVEHNKLVTENKWLKEELAATKKMLLDQTKRTCRILPRVGTINERLRQENE